MNASQCLFSPTGREHARPNLYPVLACGALVLAADPDGTAARPILIRSEVSMSDLPGYQALRAPV